MSFENHSLNSSWLSKSVGMMKWRRAHSSAIEFCMGVPDNSNLLRQLNPSSSFHRILLLLFIACTKTKSWSTSLQRFIYVKAHKIPTGIGTYFKMWINFVNTLPTFSTSAIGYHKLHMLTGFETQRDRAAFLLLLHKLSKQK